jgi:hypothetical protein
MNIMSSAIKEYVRAFLLGLACKKKCIVHSKRMRINMFGHSSTVPNEQNREAGQIKKNFKIHSIQTRRE